MGLFSKILEKLGLKKEAEVPAAKAPEVNTELYRPVPGGPLVPRQKTETPGAVRPVGGAWGGVAPKVTVPVPAAIPVVDVVAKLEKLALDNPQKLNWKESIVDLLKLLDIDSSYTARKELAVELGCPKEKMDDSAQMNVWLHKTVLEKIAANGGNIPKELLD
jgi:hypothetical protein